MCVPQYKAETSSLCVRSMFRVLGIYSFGHVVHGKKINAILTCKYVFTCLFEHEKGFQDCFRPFLILTLNIIINQDDKQIKIIECLQKTKQNVPLWVSTIGSNFSLSCIGNIRYMNINRPFNRDRSICTLRSDSCKMYPAFYRVPLDIF